MPISKPTITYPPAGASFRQGDIIPIRIDGSTVTVAPPPPPPPPPTTALSAGTIGVGTVGTGSVAITNSASASGGSGTITYQHHRSTTSGFTPGTGTAISGATNAAYTHTGLTAGTTYYFKRVASDGSTTATTTQVSATPTAATSPPPPPPAGTLAHEDYFVGTVGALVSARTPPIGTGYAAVQSDLKILDGTTGLITSTPATSSAYVNASTAFSSADYTVRGQIRFIGTSRAGNVGVYGRGGTTITNSKIANGILLRMGSQPDAALNQLSFWSHINGVNTQVASVTFTVDTTKFLNLKLVFAGDTVTAYYGWDVEPNIVLGTLTDAALGTGGPLAGGKPGVVQESTSATTEAEGAKLAFFSVTV